MEGCPTSVTENWTLPEQPTIGTVTRVPLGGDGFSAPSHAYSIFDASIVGDASGGNMRLSCTMDNRSCSLVSYMCGQDEQVASANASVRMLVTGGNVPEQSDQAVVTAISALADVRTIARTFSPVPIVLPGGSFNINPRIIFRMVNVLDDEYFLNAWIFCFDIRVRELTPMGPLLWARGST